VVWWIYIAYLPPFQSVHSFKVTDMSAYRPAYVCTLKSLLWRFRRNVRNHLSRLDEQVYRLLLSALKAANKCAETSHQNSATFDVLQNEGNTDSSSCSNNQSYCMWRHDSNYKNIDVCLCIYGMRKLISAQLKILMANWPYNNVIRAPILTD